MKSVNFSGDSVRHNILGFHLCSGESQFVRTGATRVYCYASGLDVHCRLPDDSDTGMIIGEEADPDVL